MNDHDELRQILSQWLQGKRLDDAVLSMSLFLSRIIAEHDQAMLSMRHHPAKSVGEQFVQSPEYRRLRIVRDDE